MIQVIACQRYVTSYNFTLKYYKFYCGRGRSIHIYLTVTQNAHTQMWQMKSGSEMKIYVVKMDNNDPWVEWLMCISTKIVNPINIATSRSLPFSRKHHRDEMDDGEREKTKKAVRCAWNTNCLWWTNKLYFLLTHTHKRRNLVHILEELSLLVKCFWGVLKRHIWEK